MVETLTWHQCGNACLDLSVQILGYGAGAGGGAGAGAARSRVDGGGAGGAGGAGAGAGAGAGGAGAGGAGAGGTVNKGVSYLRVGLHVSSGLRKHLHTTRYYHTTPLHYITTHHTTPHHCITIYATLHTQQPDQQLEESRLQKLTAAVSRVGETT